MYIIPCIEITNRKQAPRILNVRKKEYYLSFRFGWGPVLLLVTLATFSLRRQKIARTWKQPRCPSADEWIRKLWNIYTMEYYSAIKKNTF